MPISTGPSIRGVCRILNQNSCGSGSICGRQPDGKALIMTNAHVAGTKIGRVVKVMVESTGDTIQARVIMAAYSDKTVSDWAVLETLQPYEKIEPTYLSKKKPSGSHYTKGFPRCRPHAGTDITTHSFNQLGVWFWEPDSIGGQSGSGVWSDTDNLQYGLLTWLWNRHGAGQQTAVIYDQARNKTTAGAPRPDGLEEVWDFDVAGLDTTGCDDPILENGFSQEVSIIELPIWAEDIDEPIPPPDNRPKGFSSDNFVEYCRDVEELHQKWRLRFEDADSSFSPANPNPDPDPGSAGPTFGL